MIVLSDIELQIKGVSETTTKKEWIDHGGYIDGGYYVEKTVARDKPKVIVHFKATVDIKLKIGGLYFDGFNCFYAISENKIVNLEIYMDYFELPKKLIMFGNAFAETKSI